MNSSYQVNAAVTLHVPCKITWLVYARAADSHAEHY